MKHPDCSVPETECRIMHHGTVSTAMAWTPIYDGTGKLIGDGDPNIKVERYSCTTCHRAWIRHTERGVVSILTSLGEAGSTA